MSNFLFKLYANDVRYEGAFVVIPLNVKRAKNPGDPSLLSLLQIGDGVYLWEHEEPRDSSRAGRGLSLKGIIDRIIGEYAYISITQRMGNRYVGKTNLVHGSPIERVVLGFSHKKFLELSEADILFLESIFQNRR